jgi:ABC-type Fe3+-hydroxamate transport system substrate-binding protein
MKYLMFVCLVSFAVVTLAACSDTTSSAPTTSSSAMAPDTKDMKK